MPHQLGRLILPALRWRAETGFGHEAAAIADALDVGVGGFILFGGTVESVRRLTADLIRRAERPLLIASDLERGAGQQVNGLTEFPPPAALAALGDAAVVRWAGAVTAQEARAVGINWVFAPVADLDLLPENPIVQTRAFGADPTRVATYVRSWIEGCQGAGALACAKHFPGHGRTTVDSHLALPVVDASEASLRDTDLVPFAVAVESGVATLMTAHVAYPDLDPSRRGGHALPSDPRPLAHRDGIRRAGGHGRAHHGRCARGAAGVGCRGRSGLGRSGPAALSEGSATGARGAGPGPGRGSLAEPRVKEALRRYERALAVATAPTPPVTRGPFESAAALADELLAQGMLRGAPPKLSGPVDLVVVDDDVGGPYPPGPSDWTEQALGPQLVSRYDGGSRVVLVFSEPRAWKGRSGFGAAARDALANSAARADLIVLFGHPRLLEEIPSDAPVLLAWHRQRLMQEAVGRWIRRRLR